MSEHQKAKHFEWDGKTIKAKGVKIYKKFWKDTKFDFITTDIIEDMKEDYVLGLYKNKKVVGYTRDSKEAIKQLVGKWILCQKVGSAIVPIVANSKSVGTPRWYLIKGQDIYSGNLREHMRGFIMDKIKECYKPYVKNIPVIESYPIKITCKLYDTIKNPYHKVRAEVGQQWDIDNYMFPYNKAFPDLLVALGKIKNDDRLHLPSSIGVEFVPIENHEDRKLVYVISKDERPEIKDNKVYQAYFAIKRITESDIDGSYETEDLDLIKDNETPY